MAKFEELPSPNEDMGLLWAALRRLQEPEVGREEAKRLRLIIQGVKSYIHLDSDYVVRIRRTESEMLSQWKHLLAQWKMEMERAKTPQDKAKFEERVHNAEQHVKTFIEAGIKEAP